MHHVAQDYLLQQGLAEALLCHDKPMRFSRRFATLEKVAHLYSAILEKPGSAIAVSPRHILATLGKADGMTIPPEITLYLAKLNAGEIRRKRGRIRSDSEPMHLVLGVHFLLVEAGKAGLWNPSGRETGVEYAADQAYQICRRAFPDHDWSVWWGPRHILNCASTPAGRKLREKLRPAIQELLGDSHPLEFGKFLSHNN